MASRREGWGVEGRGGGKREGWGVEGKGGDCWWGTGRVRVGKGGVEGWVRGE